LVAGMDVNQLSVDGQSVGEVVKIKLADRNAKLKMIGDHIGVQAFKQQIEHTISPIESLINELTGGNGK
jgi:phage terminase small subunit